MYPFFATSAKNAGIKVGVYIYSQAVSVPEGIEEADYIIDQLGGVALDLPVVLDYEFYTDGRLEKADLSKEDGTSIANAFCAEKAIRPITAKNMKNFFIIVFVLIN